jgi:hypothetical protein
VIASNVANVKTMKTDLRNHLCTAAKLGGCLGALILNATSFADSSVGIGTVLGNSLSAASPRTRLIDPDWTKAKHTPSGQMFSLPFAMPGAGQIKKTGGGWEYSGRLEFGLIGGDADERNARFRTYQDPDNGAYLNNFSLQLKQPASGHYLEATGGGAGRDDQYYGLEFGRYNDWKVKLYYSEIPHVFTDRYRTLWSGIGTDNLTLLPGLTAGGTASTANDNANVAALALSNPTTLSLKRKQGGIRVDLNLSDTWKVYASYTNEERKGARPFGAVWGAGPGGTAPIQIPESIDYTTHDFLAGLSHSGDLSVFNFRVTASLFRNHIDTLTFQEPYRLAPGAGVTSVPATGAFTQGRMDLTPDNTAYNARAEYTRSLPNFYNGSFTAVLSGGKWRQNDSLIPYTTIANLALANVTLLPGGGWDTTGALSRRTANAAVDTRLTDLTLALNPTTNLNLKIKARFHETKNNTDPFLVVNPNAVYLDTDGTTPGNQSAGLTLDGVTGVWGRLLNDGTGQGILMGANTTAAGNIPIKSVYYGIKQYRFGTSGEYRLNKLSTLSAALEREIMKRENRVRDRTWEDKAKLTYVNRGLGDSSLRLSYEYAQRRGSDYRVSTYDGAFSAALVPMPTVTGANVATWAVRNNSGIRTFDLADRDQHVVNLRVNTMLRPELDAGVSLQAREADFPDSSYGRTKRSQRSANLDLSYQPSPRRSLYAFYSYQLGRNRQGSIAQPAAAVIIGQVTPLGTITPTNAIEIGSAPGGPIYPLIQAWTAQSEDRNHVVGAGLKQELGKASLSVDYTYTYGRTLIAYDYTIGGAISAANAVFAGSGMPDLEFDMDYLDASLRYPLTDALSVRLFCRYQKERIRDWHYRNLELAPVIGAPAALPTAVILDSGPHDFEVSWYGIMMQIEF